MTNSLFEKRETKTEREREHHKEMERECLLVVLSEQRAGTSLFPRSYSILDESCWTTKTKGAGTSQATVACVYTGWKRRRGLILRSEDSGLKVGKQTNNYHQKPATDIAPYQIHKLHLWAHILWILQPRSSVLNSCQCLIFFWPLIKSET